MQKAQSLGNLIELINKIEHYLHTFYNGLLYSTRITLDVFAWGTLMNKDCEDANALI